MLSCVSWCVRKKKLKILPARFWSLHHSECWTRLHHPLWHHAPQPKNHIFLSFQCYQSLGMLWFMNKHCLVRVQINSQMFITLSHVLARTEYSWYGSLKNCWLWICNHPLVIVKYIWKKKKKIKREKRIWCRLAYKKDCIIAPIISREIRRERRQLTRQQKLKPQNSTSSMMQIC